VNKKTSNPRLPEYNINSVNEIRDPHVWPITVVSVDKGVVTDFGGIKGP